MEIKIEKLTKVYGDKTALDIDDLLIQSGELVGLVGNNGAGKTTLLRLILDLIKADTGRVLSAGQDVTGVPDLTSSPDASSASSSPKATFKTADNIAWKRYTGSFIDGRFLIDFYTPEEYFTFIGKLYSLTPDTVRERLTKFEPLMHDEILGTKKYLRDFSEGNRQKIGIIGAMMIHPKVLLLDEPFNYLDPSSQIVVARLIAELNQTLGTTVLISSHNLSFVSDISTRILLLEKGKIIKDLSNKEGDAIAELNDYFNAEA
ncbi:MAG: ABC transporter ATP-binding protein [Bacteroidales bacterium]|nr:ABC transporter ATP-binding protein [Bacteroidales bacterium]